MSVRLCDRRKLAAHVHLVALRRSKRANLLRAASSSGSFRGRAMDLSRLHLWLVDAFTDPELRRVVMLGPDGERIAADIPTAGSLTDLAFETARAWKRHAVDRRALLDHLLAYRPNRRAELIELLGEPEVVEPSRPRPDGIHVVIELQSDSTLNEVESHQLGVYLRRLAEATAPGANIDIRVTKVLEFSISVLATAEVTIFGNFEDVKVAGHEVGKFHSPPWAIPAVDFTIDYDDQRLVFPAYALVPTQHLYPS